MGYKANEYKKILINKISTKGHVLNASHNIYIDRIRTLEYQITLISTMFGVTSSKSYELSKSLRLYTYLM